MMLSRILRLLVFNGQSLELFTIQIFQIILCRFIHRIQEPPIVVACPSKRRYD